MKSLYEQMDGTYRQEGDYLIPNLLPPEGSDAPLGKYGRLRRTFLKEYHNGIYTAMLMDGSLWDHLHEIDLSCKERLDLLVSQMAEPSSKSSMSPLPWDESPRNALTVC